VNDLHQRLVEEHQRLLRLDKLSSIGLLAASVAHEVNNPLAGVANLVKTLRDNPALPGNKRDEYIEAILDGLERMKLSVRGLLDFAREQPLTIARIDIGETAGALLRLTGDVFRRKGIVVDNQIAVGTVHVRADRQRLMQALINLLLNAAHATPAGGRVVIEALMREGQIGIRIHDSGPGIPKELISKVFEPFFTTKPVGEGTGLGLAIVQSIVKAHGGELVLESPGTGTVATLWLTRG
jgi:signal transduction histidine kinase